MFSYTGKIARDLIVHRIYSLFPTLNTCVFLGLSPTQSDAMVDKHHVYMLRNGRISMVFLSPSLFSLFAFGLYTSLFFFPGWSDLQERGLLGPSHRRRGPQREVSVFRQPMSVFLLFLENVN